MTERDADSESQSGNILNEIEKRREFRIILYIRMLLY